MRMTKEINIKQSRFRDASWFEKIDALVMPIIIGGAGGIGSWLTLFLARMMPTSNHIFLYDFDNVEEINMAGQLFGKTDVGKPKVEAVRDLIHNYSGFSNIMPMNEKYVKDSLKGPIMFSAFDNMEARKVMFENWVTESKNSKDAIFIDGRLLAEQLQVFYVTPDKIDEYRKFLFDDSEVESENCSYKQTTHFAATIAAKMVQGFTNHFVSDMSILPFYYEEIGSLFNTITKD